MLSAWHFSAAFHVDLTVRWGTLDCVSLLVAVALPFLARSWLAACQVYLLILHACLTFQRTIAALLHLLMMLVQDQEAAYLMFDIFMVATSASSEAVAAAVDMLRQLRGEVWPPCDRLSAEDIAEIARGYFDDHKARLHSLHSHPHSVMRCNMLTVAVWLSGTYRSSVSGCVL